MAPAAPRYRFAPSPTGIFHIGGARTALYNWALAKQESGTFVLRIEDTDEVRNHPEWVNGIIDALAWLGIAEDDTTFEGPYFQSWFAAAHVAAARRLYEQGLAYYCDLTPEQIEERARARGKPGYDGFSRDRGLEPGPGRVLRFRVPDGVTVVDDVIRGAVTFEHENLEDFVLLRGNGSPVFLLANVVDDIEMGITNVVRGEEHLSNTPKQQLLWSALGKEPPVWAHVPVLVNEARKKLSKRRDKVALESYRDEGYLAAAMINYLMTLGWAPRSPGHRPDPAGQTEIVPWAVIERSFRLEDVTHSPAYFDVKKLAAFNGEYIRMLSVDEFIAACEPFLPVEYDRNVFAAIAPHVQSRVVTLAEAGPMVDFLMRPDPVIEHDSWIKAMHQPWSRAVLVETADAYARASWVAAALKAVLERVGTSHGIKLGKAQAPVRVAVTGRSVGPPLFESLEVLGRDATLRRLQTAVARLARQ
jgi:glutamyl-tRNA synthetase